MVSVLFRLMSMRAAKKRIRKNLHYSCRRRSLLLGGLIRGSQAAERTRTRTHTTKQSLSLRLFEEF